MTFNKHEHPSSWHLQWSVRAYWRSHHTVVNVPCMKCYTYPCSWHASVTLFVSAVKLVCNPLKRRATPCIFCLKSKLMASPLDVVKMYATDCQLAKDKKLQTSPMLTVNKDVLHSQIIVVIGVTNRKMWFHSLQSSHNASGALFSHIVFCLFQN